LGKESRSRLCSPLLFDTAETKQEYTAVTPGV